jgi:hypothetical protein
VQFGPLSNIKLAIVSKVASDVRKARVEAMVESNRGDIPASPAVLMEDMVTAN